MTGSRVMIGIFHTREVAIRKHYQKRTISLSSEQGAFVDRLVASGDYSTVGEVVRDGLRALQERKSAIDRWLRERSRRPMTA